MKLLPHWVLTDSRPAFYDSESATAIEMTAKIYGAMNQLIEGYNSYVDELNKNIEGFESETQAQAECFKECITKTVSDYIKTIDMRMDEATVYMKTNLEETANKYLAEILEDLEQTIAQFKADREILMETFEQQNAAIKQQNNVLSAAITNMNNRLAEQDAKLDEAVTYMHANIHESVTAAVEELIRNGEIVMGLAFNEEDGSLTFHARNVVYDTDLALEYEEATETIYIRESEGVLIDG